MNVLLYGAQGEPLITKPDDRIEIPEGFDPMAPQPGVACFGCGCTDARGCPPDGCSWVGPGWCSSCQPELAEAWAEAMDGAFGQ